MCSFPFLQISHPLSSMQAVVKNYLSGGGTGLFPEGPKFPQHLPGIDEAGDVGVTCSHYTVKPGGEKKKKPTELLANTFVCLEKLLKAGVL